MSGPFGRSDRPDVPTLVGMTGPGIVRDYPDYAPRPGERGYAIVPESSEPNGVVPCKVIGYRDGLAQCETSTGTVRVPQSNVFVFAVMAHAAVDFERYALELDELSQLGDK